MFMNRKTQLALATATVSGALLFSQVNADADTYTLQSGDSFYSVSQLYGMDVYDLAALNGMSIYDKIVPGQTLQVPD
ncbi:LysM peptidoglycan-binding domain-containing protein, partial [Enterococcus faecium]|uniref:LysM peptidoglycan-binding domain-containing protein n=1 Tax=Enterococcus faecium TaxID=1352 RepID=UPI0039FCD36E